MSLRLRLLLLAVACSLPATAPAQNPWTVTLAPTLDPLPIGVCAAVQFKLVDPATNDVPRKPDGKRVSIADFDMAATTSDGVSTRGMWLDATNWRVCACQAAQVGTAGTIAATYPGPSVTRATLVRGVAFTTTAAFKIGKAQGTFEPPVCKQSTVARGTPGSTPGSSAPVPLGGQPVARTAPTAAAPPPAGPAPQFLQSKGTPAEAVVTWDAPYANPGPTGYVVERWKPSDPTCCLKTSAVLPGTTRSYTDAVQWPGTWRFRVTAQYADGRRGSTWVNYDYPLPNAPTNVKAEQFGRDTVVVTWTGDTAAAYFGIIGPPATTPVQGKAGKHVFTKVPDGKHTYQVATFYSGSTIGAPNQSSTWVSAPAVNVSSRFYRIVAEQIQVAFETVDAPLSTDGKFDEIFVVSRAELVGRQDNSVTWSPVQMSAVHGDVTGFLPQKRVQVGTASPQGGIQRGDKFPVWSAPSTASPLGAPGFVLWQGELRDGKDDLVLHPLIFEWDQPDSDLSRNFNAYCGYQLCSWANYLSGVGSKSIHMPQVQALIAGPVMASADGVRIWPGEMPHLERHDRDRPIGMRVKLPMPVSMGISAQLFDKVVVFSREKIEAALVNGSARVSVRFWDHEMTASGAQIPVNYLNGDYTLVLRVDRLP